MNKVMLCIMDGVGIRFNPVGNAFLNANKPNLDRLVKQYPHTTLTASETAVGLPEGQMGNSEVGHLNIGAGRIVYQSLELINKGIKDKTIFNNDNLLKAIRYAKKNSLRIHIMGLLSDGGIHSHINHYISIAQFICDNNIEAYADIITDGRDTDPHVSLNYISELTKKVPNIKLGSISGRYYAMDRDNREERTNLYYDTIRGNNDNYNPDVENIIESSYSNNISDEFIIPTLINKEAILKDNDIVIWINFRPDRARQIITKLENNKIRCLTMMKVSDSIKSPYMYDGIHVDMPLGEYISSLGLSQLRIAETEKYAHVTYYFDGGEEKSYPHCKKILIPSPEVATYDLKPEMSAHEVTDTLINELKNNYDLIVINYANPDMVGHTGNYEATIKAIECIDECIGKIVDNLGDITLIITADHGNSEYMLDDKNNIVTTHSTSKVPFIICSNNYTIHEGSLSDIAPTILDIIGINKPSVMTGESLIDNKNLIN